MACFSFCSGAVRSAGLPRPWGHGRYEIHFALGAVHRLGLEDFAPDALPAQPRPPEHDWRTDEDRGIGSYENANEDGEGEIAEHGAPEEIERPHRKKSCSAREDRPPECLIRSKTTMVSLIE